jgi:hypothetical protein
MGLLHSYCSFFIYTLFTLHAPLLWSNTTCVVATYLYSSLPFFVYSMVTYYPILRVFIVWLLITLYFVQYYIVRELFKVFVLFYKKFVFTNWPLF